MASQLDVYAQPYVPQVLKAFNQAPATTVSSTPVLWINFPEYVRSFAGTLFLQADPPPPQFPEESETGEKQGAELDPEHYHTYFRGTLRQEAVGLQQECEEHALYNIPLKMAKGDPRSAMFCLKVPGLRELSLPIEVGDIVQLRQLHFGMYGEVLEAPLVAYTNGGPVIAPHHVNLRHDAVVWGIDRRHERLTVRVDDLIPMSMKFNACFTVQVSRLGAMYRAVANVHKGLSPQSSWWRSMLFPEQRDGVKQNSLNKSTIDWERRDLQLNYEQIRAVDNVISNNYGVIPYLVSGPPGTGKTKTLVELALQLLAEQPSSHLLVCAPSDPAADTLTQRLRQHLAPNQLLRLNSPSRSFPEVPMTILPFCYVNDDIFSLPPFPQMMQYSIVVTSCRNAEILLRSRLANADLFKLERGLRLALHSEEANAQPRLHWTGLLMDEAAQATEPEACIPLCAVAPPADIDLTKKPVPLVVMAGDQNQLGPRSATEAVSMKRSLFERLLDRPLYRDHPLARSKHNGGIMQPLTQKMLPITRPPFANLIRNYRSHPSILATPSSLFYNDTLEPEATSTDSLLTWLGWRGRKWPVLFATNTGNDEIEQDGGGWYNNAEAQKACRFAQSFLLAGQLQQAEICIMSPFRAQVKVLRSLARKKEFNMHEVNIGPLEAFQGLESRLVILCTTRTRERFIEQDVARGLGIIHEPKRFNVALTRAKEGLIVIGNPDVLGKDANWAAFLGFCSRNGLVDDAESVEKAMQATSFSGVISKLERQLVRKEKVVAEEESGGLTNGVRGLWLDRGEEHMIWESGIEAERVAYQDEHGEDGEEDGDHEDHEANQDDEENEKGNHE